MYIQRTIEKAVKRMNSSFSVVLITGPRQLAKQQSLGVVKRIVIMFLWIHWKIAN